MCGPILCSTIATDASRQSKGYGFLIFEHEEGVQNAIKYFNGHLFYKKWVYVVPFLKNKELEQENENNVFVKNFSETMNDENLRYHFSVYGTITSAKVIGDAAGNSKCFGFVNFENEDDATNCFRNLNGKKIDGKKC